MKRLTNWILVMALSIISCATPLPSDFQNSRTPLTEDEFITIWRFPAMGSELESLNTNEEHFQALEEAMQPIFDQLISQIFTDLKNGDLTIHEPINPTNSIGYMDEKPIEDPLKKMNQKYYFHATWQNIESFQKVFHIVQRRKNTDQGFKADNLKMEIINSDPKGEWPERKFGYLFMSDLANRKYKINHNGKKYDFMAYIETVVEYAYPIAYQTPETMNGLSSLKEAFGTKKYVLEGRFNEIEWLGFEANVSDYEHVPLPDGELQKFSGMYVFAANQKTHLITREEAVEVQIKLEGDHLKAIWPDMHQYYQYRIFPTTNKQFFTVINDLIQFNKLKDDSIQCVITHENGDVVKGIRK